MPKAKGRWFRLYEDILTNRKIEELPDDLFRLWMKLMALASRMNNGGRLPESLQDIAFALRTPPERVDNGIKTLRERSLIEVTNGGTAGWQYVIHDWSEWQYKSDTSTPRVNAHRERIKKRFRNVTETPPDTDTERDTGTTVVANSLSESIPQTMSVSPKKAQPTAALRLLPPSEQPELRLVAPPVTEEATPGGRYPEAFEDLWAEYKNYGNANSSKADAFKRWAKLSAAEKRLAFDGLTGGYLVWLIGERKRKPDYPAQHLSTFLSRRGWEPFLEKRASG